MSSHIYRIIVSIGLVGLAGSLVAAPAEIMPDTEINRMVKTYCAVCHTDKARNGGLTLEHFDATTVDPSLAAMLLSKVRGGALGAAGLPNTGPVVQGALEVALTAKAARSHEWHISQTKDFATDQPIITAGIIQDLPGAKESGAAKVYRLVLTCNLVTSEGEAQLSWSPAPVTGTLHIAWDGKAPYKFKVEGREKMGNGKSGETGPAAITFYEGKGNTVKFFMPIQKLTISNLFPGESVVFPFQSLGQTDRKSMSKCFQ